MYILGGLGCHHTEKKQIISYSASQDRKYHFHDTSLQYHLEQVFIVLTTYILKSEVKTDG